MMTWENLKLVSLIFAVSVALIATKGQAMAACGPL